jgi:hypothetical protein
MAQLRREAKKPISESEARRRRDVRLADLIRRTAHIAPYFRRSRFHEEGRYRDAVKVVRAWLAGDVMSLDAAMLRRLARDDYNGRAPWSRVSARVGAP